MTSCDRMPSPSGPTSVAAKTLRPCFRRMLQHEQRGLPDRDVAHRRGLAVRQADVEADLVAGPSGELRGNRPGHDGRARAGLGHGRPVEARRELQVRRRGAGSGSVARRCRMVGRTAERPQDPGQDAGRHPEDDDDRHAGGEPGPARQVDGRPRAGRSSPGGLGPGSTRPASRRSLGPGLSRRRHGAAPGCLLLDGSARRHCRIASRIAARRPGRADRWIHPRSQGPPVYAVADHACLEWCAQVGRKVEERFRRQGGPVTGRTPIPRVSGLDPIPCPSLRARRRMAMRAGPIRAPA